MNFLTSSLVSIELIDHIESIEHIELIESIESIEHIETHRIRRKFPDPG